MAACARIACRDGAFRASTARACTCAVHRPLRARYDASLRTRRTSGERALCTGLTSHRVSRALVAACAPRAARDKGHAKRVGAQAGPLALSTTGLAKTKDASGFCYERPLMAPRTAQTARSCKAAWRGGAVLTTCMRVPAGQWRAPHGVHRTRCRPSGAHAALSGARVRSDVAYRRLASGHMAL